MKAVKLSIEQLNQIIHDINSEYHFDYVNETIHTKNPRTTVEKRTVKRHIDDMYLGAVQKIDLYLLEESVIDITAKLFGFVVNRVMSRQHQIEVPLEWSISEICHDATEMEVVYDESSKHNRLVELGFEQIPMTGRGAYELRINDDTVISVNLFDNKMFCRLDTTQGMDFNHSHTSNELKVNNIEELEECIEHIKRWIS